MNRIGSNEVTILSDPEVRRYFLGILSGNRSSEEKYNEFLEFFKLRERIEERIDREPIPIRDSDDAKRIISRTCRELDIWFPQTIVRETEDAIVKAVRRLQRSQHGNGGWGFQPEASDFWGTAYSILCLNAAKNLSHLEFAVDIDRITERGLTWIKENPDSWFVKNIRAHSGIPLYHIALAVICFSQNDRSSAFIDEEIRGIIDSQNEDGGWDANVWGEGVPSPTRVFSEVGATSFAIQALAHGRREDHAQQVKKALQWLIRTQNSEIEKGSWNDGSCLPTKERFTLSGKPSINKTCDALQGLMAGKSFYPNLVAKHQNEIRLAVDWLRDQEKPLFEDREIKGWGWDFSPFKFENTCLTLETLVKMPDAPLPLLTSNARWLIKNQYKEAGSVEDGNWRKGHTARITLSLIHFYRTIQKSALFKEDK